MISVRLIDKTRKYPRLCKYSKELFTINITIYQGIEFTFFQNAKNSALNLNFKQLKFMRFKQRIVSKN